MLYGHLSGAGGQADVRLLGNILQLDGQVGGDIEYHSVPQFEAYQARLLHYRSNALPVRREVGGAGWSQGQGGEQAGQGECV